MEDTIPNMENQPITTLNDIPWEDVLFPKIFSILSYQDLFNLQAACSEYNGLVNAYFAQLRTIEWEAVTPEVLKAICEKTSSLRYLDLSCNKWLKDETLMQVIYNNKGLTSLNICSCPKLTLLGVQPIITLKYLTNISVRRNYWVTNSFIDLLTTHLEFLEQVDLAMCMIDDSSLVPFFTRFRRLKDIDLEDVPLVSDLTLFAIADNCRDLQNLNLRWNKKIGEDSIRCVVSSCNKLHSIMVVGCVKLSSNFLAWLEKIVYCDTS